MNRLSLALAGAALAAGCQASHLSYVHELTIGLEVAVTPEGMNTVSIGYERDTYAIVPRYELPNGDTKSMSLTALSRTRIESLSDIEAEHSLATGSAAIEVAKDPTVLNQVADKIFADERDDEIANEDDVDDVEE